MNCNVNLYQKLLVRKFKKNSITEIDRKLVNNLILVVKIKLLWLDMINLNYKWTFDKKAPAFMYSKIDSDGYTIKKFYQILTMYSDMPAFTSSIEFSKNVRMQKYFRKKNKLLITLVSLQVMRLLMDGGYGRKKEEEDCS